MSESIRVPKVGDCVIFVDSKGQDNNALVGCVWGDGAGGVQPSINLAFMSPDPKREDSYGRQVDRSQTSVVHVSSQNVHGNYWCWPDEERIPYKPPTAS